MFLPSPTPPSVCRNLSPENSWVRPDGDDNKPLVLTCSRKQSRSGASQVRSLPALLEGVGGGGKGYGCSKVRSQGLAYLFAYLSTYPQPPPHLMEMKSMCFACKERGEYFSLSSAPVKRDSLKCGHMPGPLCKGISYESATSVPAAETLHARINLRK